MISRRAVLISAVAATTTGCTAMLAGGGSGSAGSADEAITRRVQSALDAQPDLKAAAIGVSTYRGRVTLSGVVDSAAVRDRAGRVARGVSGVSSVNNRLRLAVR